MTDVVADQSKLEGGAPSLNHQSPLPLWKGRLGGGKAPPRRRWSYTGIVMPDVSYKEQLKPSAFREEPFLRKLEEFSSTNSVSVSPSMSNSSARPSLSNQYSSSSMNKFSLFPSVSQSSISSVISSLSSRYSRGSESDLFEAPIEAASIHDNQENAERKSGDSLDSIFKSNPNIKLSVTFVPPDI